jgi:hypothetical protein
MDSGSRRRKKKTQLAIVTLEIRHSKNNTIKHKPYKATPESASVSCVYFFLFSRVPSIIYFPIAAIIERRNSNVMIASCVNFFLLRPSGNMKCEGYWRRGGHGMCEDKRHQERKGTKTSSEEEGEGKGREGNRKRRQGEGRGG